MNRLLNFATNHPFPFVLLAIVGWIVLGVLGAIAAMLILDAPLTGSIVQSSGTLFATVCLLAFAWRWGWLKPAGITRLGGLSLWLVTAAAAIYIFFAYQLAFFGEITLGIDQLQNPDARNILMRQVVVGFVEETMFRGILLYALVRVWGGSRRGMLAAIGMTALLFGTLHSLQALAGNDGLQLVLTILNCVVAGIWLGAMVLWGGSIWPAVLLHALSNAIVQLTFLSGTAQGFIDNGLVLATLADLVLVLVFGALLLHKMPTGIPSPAEDSQVMPKSRRNWRGKIAA